MKDKYVKNKACDDEFYKNLIVTYLKTYNSAAREDIRKLLFDKFSDTLDYEQKDQK